ncbi:Sterol-4-alpha-carboxylate 3-dehydrogenase, decarboxylating [Cytospora mali]|uniref:Sterol-4-alpha-carboxylate 3-dehydrogenase, decarboxylating n=1 Tax=Cytospora mali TaxID=578113 RepID=A0A194VUB7_CYTMA|nr:Sterol-4-alpha-carboxylate 3-dehydrogenase, decarboxylating [Valsa mali]
MLEYEPNADIHVLDTHVLDISQHNQVPGATYYKCDISSLSEVEAIFAKCKPKTVFHVASPDPANVQPALFRKVNVTGSHNLLLAAQKIATVKAFIYTCSSSVIHDNYSDLKRACTLSKAEAETSILAANRANGDSSILTASIRVASAFGERDYTTFAKIAANARKGKANMQIGNSQNLYDVTYVSNLVDAHPLAAQGLLRAHGKPLTSPATRVDGEAFFISNDEPILF